MIELPAKWGRYLEDQPQTGMGYWVVTVQVRERRLGRRTRAPESAPEEEVRTLSTKRSTG